MASKKKKEEWHQAIASRIRSLRKAVGMTQEQLAERADIAPQYLSRLETARQVPSLDIIIDLAEALNTSPFALLVEPQKDMQAERVNRMAAIFITLVEEDAAFIESQIADWIAYLKDIRS